MTIWYQPFTLDDINQRGKGTMTDFLNIIFTAIGDDTLAATMPASERTKQPFGIIHGGANVVLAETLASVAANAVIDLKAFHCVGLDINANHLRAVKEGIVTGVTHPVHIGRTTQVWQIDIYNEARQLTCVSRMTAAVIARNV
jgi:1,4-dihydroxy-2-naphthoyl-CoA hydrolase